MTSRGQSSDVHSQSWFAPTRHTVLHPSHARTAHAHSSLARVHVLNRNRNTLADAHSLAVAVHLHAGGITDWPLIPNELSSLPHSFFDRAILTSLRPIEIPLGRTFCCRTTLRAFMPIVVSSDSTSCTPTMMVTQPPLLPRRCAPSRPHHGVFAQTQSRGVRSTLLYRSHGPFAHTHVRAASIHLLHPSHHRFAHTHGRLARVQLLWRRTNPTSFTAKIVPSGATLS